MDEEICLNIKPYMQPQPTKNKGGDCFACALTALLCYLFPEKNVNFETVWQYFMNPSHTGTPILCNEWIGMQKAIDKAKNDGFNVEKELYIVKPDFDLRYGSHTYYHFYPTGDFNDALKEKLSDGWIAIQEINFAGTGPLNSNNQTNDSDHFVLVDGIKEVRERINEHASRIHPYVHVVCSAKGSYWIKTEDFVKKHGAAGWILVKRLTA